jgi:hypothetical protein
MLNIFKRFGKRCCFQLHGCLRGGGGSPYIDPAVGDEPQYVYVYMEFDVPAISTNLQITMEQWAI